jgi:uncharacterized membrane protein YeaQ/YmgE (transglycosylase-associated protein family)
LTSRRQCNQTSASAFSSATAQRTESNMSGVGWFATIVIGILAGWIAEKVMARNHGLITNLIVGIVGSLIGAFVAHALGFDYAGFWSSLAVSALGAIILLFVLGLFRRRSTSY